MFSIGAQVPGAFPLVERYGFGLTVTPDGRTVWLDSPDNPVPCRG
ncbi:hypothetical protein AB0D10_18390 [Kitasatospora sp. NPDC048545]